jgi:hypothetical protein
LRSARIAPEVRTVPTPSRRSFLTAAAGLALAGGLHADEPAPTPGRFRTRPEKPPTEGRKPIAVVCSVYRPMSHAYHIAGRFLHGYARRGKFHLPKHFVASLYTDQTPENDLTAEASKEFGVRLSKTVEDALTLGTGKLAVEGVLLIVEHGDYPTNAKGQILYPRAELFEKVAAVYRKEGRAVPVFCDKHLSYSFAKAKGMADTAAELKVPMIAGSSLPLTWRRPELELPIDCPLEDGLLAAYGGLEIYGIHSLEALQVMMERRKGGETGVKAVTCLRGEEVWKAADAGKWSWDLLDAALSHSETVNPGDVQRNVGTPVTHTTKPNAPAAAFLVEYRDGTRGTVLLLNGHLQDFVFAGRVKGRKDPVGCLFYLPMPPGARYFDCQTAAIERLLETGKPPFPLARTLLTSGTLDFALDSHQQGGKRVETPELAVAYTAPADSGFMRGPVAGE